MRAPAALAVVLAACSAAPLQTLGSSVAALRSPTGCSPGDELDDRACIQALLDEACAAGGDTVHLAAGVWNLTRPAQVPGSRDNASLWLECSGLELEGDGPATVLMMTGDGLASDWSAVRLSSNAGAPLERVVVQDLTIASDLATNPNEQTHLLMVGSTATAPGPISDVALRRLTLRHPVRPEVSGDCLRFVGEAATPISRVEVDRVTFAACDRSGASIQRGVQELELHDSHFMDIGKTAIDMEPSGLGPIRSIALRRLTIDKGGASFAGRAEAGQEAVDIVLEDSTVNGGLGLTYARRVTLARDTIDAVSLDGTAALNIKASSEVLAEGCTIRRRTGSIPGPTVKMEGHNGIFSSGLQLRQNVIASEVDGEVVSLDSAQDVTVEGNRITFGGPTAASSNGIASKAAGRDVDGLVLAGNRFRGPLAAAIKLSGNPFLIGTVQISGNTSGGTTSGLRCENPAKFSRPVVQGGGYLYGGPATSGCSGVTVAGQWP